MGLFSAIAGLFKQARQENREKEHFQGSEEGWDRLIQKSLELADKYDFLHEVLTTDWSQKDLAEKDKQVRKIKRFVNRVLIPTAGGLSLLGVPGIFVYTPCQIIGAVAIGHIYRSDLTLTVESAKAVIAIALWGKLGQLTWINLVELIPLPAGLGIVVIPFVISWTSIALDKVQDYYRSQLIQDFEPTVTNSEPKESVAQESSNHPSSNKPAVTEPDPSPDPYSKAYELLERIENGGKILFPAQAKR
jgi:hypothetical protein